MSPAAQRLLTNRLGIQRTQSTSSQRQNALTPSPVVRDGLLGDRTPRTPLNVGIIKHTPKTSSSTSTPTASSASSLTDNLLNLKR